MPLLSLDDDVLNFILVNLSGKDALALSLTAKSIHPIAHRRVLHTVQVTHRKGGVHKMCAYMLADVSNRWIWVRDLEIRGYSSSDGYLWPTDGLAWVPLFTDLLTHTSNLQSLRIDMLKDVLEYYPPFGSALSGMTTLLDLDFRQVDDCGMELISHFRSEPRSLVLHQDEKQINKLKELSHHYARKLFSNLTPLRILQHLELFILDMGSITSLSNAGVDLQLPAVRRLSLHETDVSIETLSHIFPNVQHFILHNIKGHPEGTGGWPSLAYAMGPQAVLYYIHIACPVRFLDFQGSTRYQPKELLELLQNLSPVFLHGIGHYFRASTPVVYKGILQAAPKAKCLETTMSLFQDNDKTSPCIDEMGEILASSSLIVIECHVVHNELWKDLMDTILKIWLPLFANHGSIIRYLSVKGYRRYRGRNLCETTWWRASGCGAQRVVECMPNEVGERIHEYLHSAEFDHEADFDDTTFMRNAGPREIVARVGHPLASHSFFETPAPVEVRDPYSLFDYRL